MTGTPARWLIDTSALTRLDKPPVNEVLFPRIDSGHVAVSLPTKIEFGHSAQSVAGYADVLRRLFSRLLPLLITPRAEERVEQVQLWLMERGQHRGISFQDLLVAAVAEDHRIPVLHYDKDFDLIAEITGQPTEWVVPRGTVD